MNNIEISVVIPVYGCPAALRPLHERLTKVLNDLTKDYEIILVNDGCPKGSWQIIEEICKEDRKVKGVNLSRNFGQLHSTNAGMALSKGKYVVLMDCDLQDKPESIYDLYKEIQKGYDFVLSRRKGRQDSRLTLWFSQMFYKVYNYFSEGTNFDKDIGNLSISTRRVVDEYNKIADRNTSFVPMLIWMGYPSSIVNLEAEERFEGHSSYTFSKKIDMAIDLLTSNSIKPLKLVMKSGMVIALVGFIYLLVQVVRYFVRGDLSEGWTSIIASIFLIGGIILICLGGVGIYLGNIFDQTKGVPEYLIDTILNDEK